MIDARDLRVGNWALGANGIPQKVAYVGETIGLHNETGGTDKYQVNPIISFDIKDLQPIPLSPEILEKAGSEKKITTHSCKLFDTTIIYYELEFRGMQYITLRVQDFGGELVNYIWESSHKVSLNYVHQLQNLVYVVTGNELKIDL